MTIAMWWVTGTLLLSALLAGVMAGYCLTIGAYLTHLVARQAIEPFQQSYAPFRARRRIKLYYGLLLITQFAAAAVSLALHAAHYPLESQLMAVLVLPLLLSIHICSGLASLEERLLSGARFTPNESRRFLRLNLPLYRLYAVLYTVAAVWLGASTR